MDPSIFKLGFFGELLPDNKLCFAPFSPCREKGAQRGATQGRYPRYLPWESIPLICAPFRRGEKALCAVKSQFDGEPRCRQSADHLGCLPNRGEALQQANHRLRDGRIRADGAPPFVRVCGSCRPYAPSTAFAGWRKWCAHQEDSFLRKDPWVPSLSGALWAPFSRQGEKGAKKHNLLLGCNSPINPNLKDSGFSAL